MVLKQVIVVRDDLKLSKGKMSAQVAHASLAAYKNCKPPARAEWESEGAKKVVLKVQTLSELEETFLSAKRARLPAEKIVDAGHTEIAPGTTTCVGIGPAEESEIDAVTGKLKMM
ncbi:MAG: peptidyl-tRNA hydrolase Pth2 [archaeon]